MKGSAFQFKRGAIGSGNGGRTRTSLRDRDTIPGLQGDNAVERRGRGNMRLVHRNQAERQTLETSADLDIENHHGLSRVRTEPRLSNEARSRQPIFNCSTCIRRGSRAPGHRLFWTS